MITIQRLEDTIKFTFDNNPLYLHDGTIEVPVNSLSLLIDESDIATFLKADSNDIFLSCSLDELDMTKEELLTWYKENATTGGGSIDPEEVEEIVEEVTENLFGYAEYDSQNTRINFKHDASGDVLTYIDASDFVIDGMIDNVEIVTVQGVNYLKITFNTESGKEPILIPLSDIFDPDEYYTKTEVDNALSGKQDTLISGTNIKTINNESLLGSGNIDIQGGGGISSAECQTMIDNSISGKVDTSVFEEKERIIAASLVDLDERKADTSAVTQAISAAVSGKADSSAVTQEISAAVSGKVDTSAITTSITSVSTDAQIPSAKAVYDKLGGLSLVKLTQAQYDALSPNYDNNTLYVIV